MILNLESSSSQIDGLNTLKSVANHHKTSEEGTEELQNQNAANVLSDQDNDNGFLSKWSTKRKVIVGVTVLVTLLVIVGLSVALALSMRTRVKTVSKYKEIILPDGSRARSTEIEVSDSKSFAKVMRVETVSEKSSRLLQSDQQSQPRIVRDHINLEEAGIIITYRLGSVELLVEQNQFMDYVISQIKTQRLLQEETQFDESDLLRAALEQLTDIIEYELKGTASQQFQPVEMSIYQENDQSNKLELVQNHESGKKKTRLLFRKSKFSKRFGKMMRIVRQTLRNVIGSKITDKMKLVQNNLHDVNKVESNSGTSLKSDDFTSNAQSENNQQQTLFQSSNEDQSNIEETALKSAQHSNSTEIFENSSNEQILKSNSDVRIKRGRYRLPPTKRNVNFVKSCYPFKQKGKAEFKCRERNKSSSVEKNNSNNAESSINVYQRAVIDL